MANNNTQEPLNIYEKLQKIQSSLKAPRSQYNKFGNYKYRKAEDILEAVKPLLSEYGCTLVCSDELMLIGDRYYIKASVTITDIKDEDAHITATAYAREEDEKKGMDGSQVTGASSSYARKYALNGLLCIDDTADSDTTNVGDSEAAPAPKKPTKKAAPAPQPEPAPAPAPASDLILHMEKELYNRWVAGIARNQTTKAGHPCREAFIAQYHPNEFQLEQLDKDVFAYKLQNNIQ